MEDGVDVAVRRQLELVGEGADLVVDLQGAEEFVGELRARAVGDGGLCVRLELDQDGVLYLKGALSPMSIGLFLEAKSGAEKLFPQVRRVPPPPSSVEDGRRLDVRERHCPKAGLDTVESLEWGAIDREVKGRFVP